MGLVSRKKWSSDLRTIAYTLFTVDAGLERCVMASVNPFEDAEESLKVLDHEVFSPIMDRLQKALVAKEFKPDVIDTLEEGGLLLLERAWGVMVVLQDVRKGIAAEALSGETCDPELTEELKSKSLNDETVHFWEIPLPVVPNWGRDHGQDPQQLARALPDLCLPAGFQPKQEVTRRRQELGQLHHPAHRSRQGHT
jgi:hypothetical protein